MKTVSWEVSDYQYSVLTKIAEKEGKTVQALVQEQGNYYLSTKIRDFVEEPVKELPPDKLDELNSILVDTKIQFVETYLFEKAAAEGTPK